MRVETRNRWMGLQHLRCEAFEVSWSRSLVLVSLSMPVSRSANITHDIVGFLAQADKLELKDTTSEWSFWWDRRALQVFSDSLQRYISVLSGNFSIKLRVWSDRGGKVTHKFDPIVSRFPSLHPRNVSSLCRNQSRRSPYPPFFVVWNITVQGSNCSQKKVNGQIFLRKLMPQQEILSKMAKIMNDDTQ